MQKEDVGFIGVGFMGHGMAKNIVEGGYPLTVIGHRNRKPIEDLLERGAHEAKSHREVAEHSTVVFLCVTGSPQVEAIVRGPDGLLKGLRPGSIVVDCSSSNPVSTLVLAEEIAAVDATLVDAPLGRTPKEAWEGTLDTMVGASPETFERLKPLLDTWAGHIVHIGGTGDGHRMKLLMNFLSMGYAAIYSEALTLAGKVGLPPQTFDSVIRGGRMDCGFYQTFMEYTLNGNREAHLFTLGNALKDLTYLEAMADAAGMVNPVGNAIKNSFATAVAGGGSGPSDFVPMLVDHINRLNGVPSRSPK